MIWFDVVYQVSLLPRITLHCWIRGGAQPRHGLALQYIQREAWDCGGAAYPHLSPLA